MSDYTYTYQLSLDKTGFKGSKTSVVLQNDTPVSVVFNNSSMKLSLYGVFFVRRVYEPGHIQAEILVTTSINNSPTMQQMSAMLLKRPVSLLVEKSHQESGSKKVDDTYTVAENYYIHDIFPQFEKGTEVQEVTKVDKKTGKTVTEKVNVDINCVYIKLDIFSADKLLALQKFSQAYLGQKLFGDILPSIQGSCSLVYQAEVDGVISETSVPLQSTVQKLPQLGYQGKILQLKAGKTDEYDLVDAQVELVQPYLVQYDETFYDFLRRTANRSGELFYFEDGALCAGIPASTTVTEIKTPRRVIFQGVSSGPLSVSDYTRDSVKDWASDKKSITKLSGDAIHSDPVKPGSSGFPSDAFLKRDNGTFVNDSRIASEEHYMMLFKDRFARDSVKDLWCGDDPDQIGSHVMSTISLVLNSTSLMEMLTNFGLKETESAVKASIKSGKATEKGNQVLEAEALNPQDDYAVLFSKVDNNTAHWITLDYTSKIRKGEQERTGQIICVDMGSDYSTVKLGSRITIPHDDRTYIVIGMEMSSSNEWQCDYEGFSVEGVAHPKGGYSQRIYAIPLKGNEEEDKDFYPPLLPDAPFRQAGAQPAFIIDSGDPVGQGRVRIRFPWQPSMEDAEKTFKDGKYQDNYDNTLAPFQAARTALEQVAKDIKAPLVGDATATQKTGADDDIYKNALSAFDTAWKAHRTNKIKLDQAKAALLMTEAGSPWIRMASPMATAGGGMYFQPEVGDEVMVDFESGNIERPYVTGTLYSKNIPAPRQGGRVIVSKNGHTIKMTDPQDGNALLSGLFPAWKFLQGYGAFDQFKIPMAGNTARMLGGIELTDQFGFYNIKMSSHDRSISIASPLGNVSMSALTGISIDAPNGDISISGKNVEISAYNKISITSGKNVKMAHDSHRLGWLSTGFDPEDAGKNIGKALTKFLGVGKLFDFSILRTLLEIFIRPVDGTLDIKSNRFLLLQAGGKTAAGEYADYNVKPFDDWKLEENEPRIFRAMLAYMRDALDKWITDFFPLHQAVVEAVEQVTPIWDFTVGPNNNKCLSTPADLDTMLGDVFGLDPTRMESVTDFNDAYLNYVSGFHFENGTPPAFRATTLNAALALTKAAVAMKRHFLHYDFNHIFPKLSDGSFVEGKLMVSRAKDAVSSLLSASEVNRLLVLRNPVVSAPAAPVGPAAPVLAAPAVIPAPGIATLDNAAPPNGGFFSTRMIPVKDFVLNGTRNPNNFKHSLQRVSAAEWQKALTRRLMCMAIEKIRQTNPFKTFVIPQAKYVPVAGVGTAPSNMTHPFSDADWARYVNEIRMEPPAASENKAVKFFSAMGGSIKDALWKAVPWESDTWSSDKSGQILFAEEKGNSYYFTNNGATAKRPNETRQDAVCKEVKEDLKAL